MCIYNGTMERRAANMITYKGTGGTFFFFWMSNGREKPHMQKPLKANKQNEGGNACDKPPKQKMKK